MVKGRNPEVHFAGLRESWIRFLAGATTLPAIKNSAPADSPESLTGRCRLLSFIRLPVLPRQPPLPPRSWASDHCKPLPDLFLRGLQARGRLGGCRRPAPPKAAGSV